MNKSRRLRDAPGDLSLLLIARDTILGQIVCEHDRLFRKTGVRPRVVRLTSAMRKLAIRDMERMMGVEAARQIIKNNRVYGMKIVIDETVKEPIYGEVPAQTV